MLELEAEAVELETDTAKPCDWDVGLYNLGPSGEGQPPGGGDIGEGQPPGGGDSGGGGESEPPEGEGGPSGEGNGGVPPEGGMGGASGGEDYVGAGDGADGDGGDPSSGSGFDTPESGVEWQVGWFVAFPLPATSRCSLLVGKIMGIIRGEEGDELKVLWYTPKKSKIPRRRSLYGKGGWSEAFKLKRGSHVRVPDKGKESVECACATFPALLSGTDFLPQFVWDAVADSVPPPDEVEGGEDGNEEEDEEVEQEEEVGDGEEDDEQGGEEENDDDEAGKQVEMSGSQEPLQRPSLKLPSQVKVPVRRSAAFYRPRRGSSTNGATPVVNEDS